MSVFSNLNWGGNCSSSNQSPINLSQSIAQPCDVLCDLVIDDGYVKDATVISTYEGLVLHNQTGLGTCKYNGDGYTCQALVVNHPSHHTIENIQADAEVIALFRTPTGKVLTVSVLVRVNPAQTDGSRFLNSFIPYANSSGSQQITLGNNWSLTMMIPPNATFYSYQGSLPLPSCESAQVVVFSSMINIDQNDFALLVKNGVAGSRPIQPLGNRQVFFNSGEQLPGGSAPKDGKVYMRLHPKKDKGESGGRHRIHRPDLGGAEAKEKQKSGFLYGLTQWASDQVMVNGILSIVSVILLMMAFGFALYFALKHNNQLEVLLSLNKQASNFGSWLRSKVVGGTPKYTSPSISSPTPPAPARTPDKPLADVVETPSSAVVPTELREADEVLGSPAQTPLSTDTTTRAPQRIPTRSASQASTRALGFTPTQSRSQTPTRPARQVIPSRGTTAASTRALGFGPKQTRGVF